MEVRGVNRYWCAFAQYPGKAPFLLGSTMLPIDAQTHEIEAALVQLWGEISPHPAPKITPVAGALYFTPEERT
jgi:hypothetical protein